MKVIFKILQPMMFRKEGEFDISAAGIQSSAQSTSIPYPSTLVGALASIKFTRPSQAVSWIEEIKEVIGKEINIKGPFLRLDNELFIYNEINDSFISITKIKDYCSLIKRMLKEKDQNLRDEINKEIEKLGEKVSKRNERIGIKLKTRKEGIKIIEEPAIYNAQFIFYKGIKAEIILDIISGTFKKGSYSIKLGGENRAASLIIEDGNTLEEIKNRRIIGNTANTLLVISPVLLKTPLRDIKNEIEKEIEANIEEIYGHVRLLGTGYSLNKEKRKPIYASLVPGSIIVLKSDINSEEIYKKGIGIAKELGYGSLIPVKLWWLWAK